VRRTYDHRLREHVVRCGAKAIARHVQIPRLTVSSWRRRGLRPVVTTEPVGEHVQHALESRARWEKQARALAAVVRLLLALLRVSGFRLERNRLLVGEAKAGILRAVSSAEPFLPLAIILRILGLEAGRFYAWRRAEKACALDDRRSCPRSSPAQLTAGELANIKDMVLAPEYRHMSLGTLARYAQRIGKVFASATRCPARHASVNRVATRKNGIPRDAMGAAVAYAVLRNVRVRSTVVVGNGGLNLE
jgi:putative transposase